MASDIDHDMDVRGIHEQLHVVFPLSLKSIVYSTRRRFFSEARLKLCCTVQADKRVSRHAHMHVTIAFLFHDPIRGGGRFAVETQIPDAITREPYLEEDESNSEGFGAKCGIFYSRTIGWPLVPYNYESSTTYIVYIYIFRFATLLPRFVPK